MTLAKKYIRPDLKWQTFSLKEMLDTLKGPRTNYVLDTTKLQKKLKEYGYQIKNSHEALEEVFQILAEKGL